MPTSFDLKTELWDAVQAKLALGYRLAVRCRDCGHHALLDAGGIVERFGAEAVVRQDADSPLSGLLRCSRCESSTVIWQLELAGPVTLIVAKTERWTITSRCFNGNPRTKKGTRLCGFGHALDIDTLIWLLGREFPVHALPQRLCCPACGGRRVELLYGIR